MINIYDIIPKKIAKSLLQPNNNRVWGLSESDIKKCSQWYSFHLFTLNAMIENNCFTSHYDVVTRKLLKTEGIRGQACLLVLQHFCNNNGVLLDYGSLDLLFYFMRQAIDDTVRIMPDGMYQQLFAALSEVLNESPVDKVLEIYRYIQDVIVRGLEVRSAAQLPGIQLNKRTAWQLFWRLNKPNIELCITLSAENVQAAKNLATIASICLPKQTQIAIGKQIYPHSKNSIVRLATAILLAKSGCYNLLENYLTELLSPPKQNKKYRYKYHESTWYSSLALVLDELIKNPLVPKEFIMQQLEKFMTAIQESSGWLGSKKIEYVNFTAFNQLIDTILDSKNGMEMAGHIIWRLCFTSQGAVATEFYNYFYKKLLERLSWPLVKELFAGLQKHAPAYVLKSVYRPLLLPHEFPQVVKSLLLDSERNTYIIERARQMQEYHDVIMAFLRLFSHHIPSLKDWVELGLVLCPDISQLKNLSSCLSSVNIAHEEFPTLLTKVGGCWKEMYGQAETQIRLSIAWEGFHLIYRMGCSLEEIISAIN